MKPVNKTRYNFNKLTKVGTTKRFGKKGYDVNLVYLSPAWGITEILSKKTGIGLELTSKSGYTISFPGIIDAVQFNTGYNLGGEVSPAQRFCGFCLSPGKILGSVNYYDKFVDEGRCLPFINTGNKNYEIFSRTIVYTIKA